MLRQILTLDFGARVSHERSVRLFAARAAGLAWDDKLVRWIIDSDSSSLFGDFCIFVLDILVLLLQIYSFWLGGKASIVFSNIRVSVVS